MAKNSKKNARWKKNRKERKRVQRNEVVVPVEEKKIEYFLPFNKKMLASLTQSLDDTNFGQLIDVSHDRKFVILRMDKLGHDFLSYSLCNGSMRAWRKMFYALEDNYLVIAGMLDVLELVDLDDFLRDTFTEAEKVEKGKVTHIRVKRIVLPAFVFELQASKYSSFFKKLNIPDVV